MSAELDKAGGRWQQCVQIRDLLLNFKICEVSTSEVHNFLYRRIRDDGLIELMEDDRNVLEVVQRIQRLPEYEQMIEARKAKFSKRRKKKDKASEQAEDVVNEPGDQLKVAMWFIKKVGGVEQAWKVMDAAAAALDKLK